MCIDTTVDGSLKVTASLIFLTSLTNRRVASWCPSQETALTRSIPESLKVFSMLETLKKPPLSSHLRDHLPPSCPAERTSMKTTDRNVLFLTHTTDLANMSCSPSISMRTLRLKIPQPALL